MIKQDSWRHSNVIVRGEILRFMKDKLFQWLLSWVRPDDDWSIQLKRRQVIFRTQVGNR